jgi:hypothetical protein
MQFFILSGHMQYKPLTVGKKSAVFATDHHILGLFKLLMKLMLIVLIK